MILKVIQSSKRLRTRYFEKWGHGWVDRKTDRFLKQLKPDDKIIDIGAGNCLLSYRLQQKGFDVTPIDIANLSYSAKISSLIYDGSNLPFKDNQFDTSLLLTVLHHTSNPELVLKEAIRVSHRIIIIEDVYFNLLQKWLTYWIDLFINLGFSDLPFNHRSDSEWKKLFRKLGLEVEEVTYHRVLLIFRQATYILEKKQR